MMEIDPKRDIDSRYILAEAIQLKSLIVVYSF